MKMSRVFRSLGPIDLRSVRRDSLLVWMIVVPLFMAALLRFGVPPLADVFLNRYRLDLTPYYPLIVSYFLIMLVPATFGMVIGFLVLDERDDGTLTALQVTPLTMKGYLAYRVAVPILLTVPALLVSVPLANLGSVWVVSILIAAVVAAPLAPMFALLLATFASNKVQGFAMLKGMGGLMLTVPLVGYFVREPWHWAFGLVPSFWPMKVYLALVSGDSQAWLYVLIGLLYQGVLLWPLVQGFSKAIRR